MVGSGFQWISTINPMFYGSLKIWLVNLPPPPPPKVPRENKGLIFGLIEGNQWLVRSYFLGASFMGVLREVPGKHGNSYHFFRQLDCWVLRVSSWRRWTSSSTAFFQVFDSWLRFACLVVGQKWQNIFPNWLFFIVSCHGRIRLKNIK